MQQFCEWLEKNPWIVAMDSSVVLSLILEILHYSGFFLLVGSTAIVDLRVMGVAARHRSPVDVANQLFPWMWTGLSMAVFSGFFMFAGDAADFYGAITFRIKVLWVLVALVVGLIVRHYVPRWDQLPSIPVWAKIVAFLSLVLWIGAILISVEVPAISGVG
ncbi:MAG TPA: hypothetical protein VEJ45_11065 [Candidatus Acidoferrales bacterium]|nr:hypothetical protein [Candidatus Acidoferrales bacterium]